MRRLTGGAATRTGGPVSTPRTAIRITGLSKKYRLFDNPRQRLKEVLDPWHRTFHQEFWALRDVDLEIPKGSTLGIIGRNGSGKSTFLQIVSGIIPPTTGEVHVDGRVAALLELGAGFDPEFTGRQNALQYVRLQGMPHGEIEARLAEIEAFADIREFYDRPIKSYSSGMFARLAFAAAINVDPEILILDEILAVGDARFQQRCYEKIHSLQSSGKTVLIVSHSPETIIDHCDSAIFLEKGRLVARGEPKAVTDRYREFLFDEAVEQYGHIAGTPRQRASDGGADKEHDNEATSPTIAEMLDFVDTVDRFPIRLGYNPQERVEGSDEANLLDYRMETNANPCTSDHFMSGMVVDIHVLTRSAKWHDQLEFGLALRRKDGLFVYGCNSVMRPSAFRRHTRDGTIVFSFALRLAIQSDYYFFNFGVFRVAAGETVRLKTRRDVVQIGVLGTSHFDGLTDIAVETVKP
jgi:ABC-type polysaccharide/polyol phosphate transport system ATPase subunit